MIVIPVLPRLIQSFTGSTAGAAHYVGLFATVFALVQFTVVYVMLLLAQQCMPNTIVLYTEYRFGWSVQQIGAYLTVVGVVGVAGMVVQALLIRRFVVRFGERAAMLFGFVCYTIAFVIYRARPSVAFLFLQRHFSRSGAL